MILRVFYAVCLSTPIFMKSVPAPSPLIQQAPQSINFLKKYGYLTGTSGALEALYTKESVEEAIKQAQRFGGIKETGNLNEETIKLFSSKRCGLPDIVKNVTSSAGSSAPSDDLNRLNDHHHHHHSSQRHHHHYDHIHHRKKRFVLTESSWRRRHLKFYIKNWSERLSQSEVVRELEKTLKIWGEYGNLRFSRTSDPSEAEITVGFYRGQHGDMNPFDGRGNVLAHAFFPDSRNGRGLAGDVHFDDDEAWSVGRADSLFKDTVDFTSVALHELGHSLGLHHSPEQGSVMNPYYRGKNELGDDDVQAMYELYVRRSMDDYDEEPHRRDDEWREDEVRRRYDEEKRQWEEKRREVERKRLDEEERKRLVDEREEKRKRYEEEKRKREEELSRQEENRKNELEKRRQEERKYELERKRQEEKRKHEEDERKRKEEEHKKLEEERKKAIEKEVERKRHENERRKWSQDQSTSIPPKSGYPKGTTFEGDDESVESHKHHDPTHRIPPTQNPHDHNEQRGPSGTNAGCTGGFSAATYLRGELFFLKENMLWRLSRPGAVHDKYPVEVRRFFHLIPEEVKTIDAMYQRDRDSSLIIFSGKRYWVFDGFKISGSRPLQDYGLPEDVERVDAITSRSGQVIIFSGNRYWGQNDTALESSLQRQPPRPISTLRWLPDRLDAALTYNDVTYLFKDDRFWYMDRNSDEAILHNSPASDYWIGC